MRTNKRHGRRGVTLVEMMLAVVLTVVVMLSVGLTTRSASGSYRSSSTESQLAMRAHGAIDRIAEALVGAQESSLILSPGPEDATEVRYRYSLGWDGATSWSLHRAFRLELEEGELDDGEDNDGDGLVDEGRLVWIEDVGEPTERKTIVTRQVRSYLEGETPNFSDDNGNGVEDERGFSAVLEDGVLTLRLTLEGRDRDRRLLTKTVETAVVLRN